VNFSKKEENFVTLEKQNFPQMFLVGEKARFVSKNFKKKTLATST
jgi:hypothetical protein